ncbi:MAG: 2-C-methyl-D-erythritol 2,4-cyclodiphosphate synthase [Proteobacteria bacterium]|jgi:2-C-methyl-D-erythritol 2,4-cyclodiphosphate synthase|nr:2-C-methyl-D-erythritol 2,4-cyclodiphosphate synthase [Pseudomonadota bacterium]
MRVGIGYDVHPLVEGRKLFLGGIEIPYSKGLLGHSDGDVLIHAICDAILGAISEGDIGVYFPDSDESIRGINSIKILSYVMELVKKKGVKVVNIDAVIAAEEPKIHPHRELIRKNIAKILNVDIDRVGIKGKTKEGLGFVGKKEGIEVYAVALLEEVRVQTPYPIP